MNLVPTLTFQIKARAGDWVVGGKMEQKSLGKRGERSREWNDGGEGGKGRWSRSAWLRETASLCGIS